MMPRKGDDLPPPASYRESARPVLAATLGRKPGPAIAARRVVPGYMVCFAGIFAVLGALAARTPDSTHELVTRTPLFGAMYTLSILGLVGFATLVFLKVTLFRASTPRLRASADELRLERPEGALSAPIETLEAEPLDLPSDNTRTGIAIRFPSGQRVRIVVGAAEERVEHDDPWDYTMDEEDYVELKKRIARSLLA